MRSLIFLADSNAVRRLSLNSSSSTRRCTYGFDRAAWAAPIAPAPALAAFFFFDAMALLESAGVVAQPYPGATLGVTPRVGQRPRAAARSRGTARGREALEARDF